MRSMTIQQPGETTAACQTWPGTSRPGGLQAPALACMLVLVLGAVGCADPQEWADRQDVTAAHQALGDGHGSQDDDLAVPEDEETADAEADSEAVARSNAFHAAERERRRAENPPAANVQPEEDQPICAVDDEPLQRRANTRLTAEAMAARPRFEPVYHREGDLGRRTEHRIPAREASPDEDLLALQSMARDAVRAQLLAEGFTAESIEERDEAMLSREDELFHLEAQRLAREHVRCAQHAGCTLAVGEEDLHD